MVGLALFLLYQSNGLANSFALPKSMLKTTSIVVQVNKGYLTAGVHSAGHYLPGGGNAVSQEPVLRE